MTSIDQTQLTGRESATDLSRSEWQDLISEAISVRPAPLAIKFFAHRSNPPSSYMDPLSAALEDGTQCWVKASRTGTKFASFEDRYKARSVVNDQIAGRIAALINAPAPEVLVAEVDKRRVRDQLQGRIWEGLHHASRHIADISGPEYRVEDADQWTKHNPAVNVPRFAQIAVFYGWLHCGTDHQFVFDGGSPQRVWTIDHGMLFGNGEVAWPNGSLVKTPEWSSKSLLARTSATIDKVIKDHVPFSMNDVRESVNRIANVTPAQIAEAVASVPDSWYLTTTERVDLAGYLHRRRRQMIDLYLAQGEK